MDDSIPLCQTQNTLQRAPKSPKLSFVSSILFFSLIFFFSFENKKLCPKIQWKYNILFWENQRGISKATILFGNLKKSIFNN